MGNKVDLMVTDDDKLRPQLTHLPEQFGKLEIEHLQLVFILRSTEKYIPSILVKRNVMPRILKIFSLQFLECAPFSEVFMTSEEATKFNEINVRSNLIAGEAFSEGDPMIPVDEVRKLWLFFRAAQGIVFGKQKVNSLFGFVSINGENIVPFIWRERSQLLPLFYFDGDCQRLDEQTLLVTDPWQLGYLRFCCMTQKVRKEFHSVNSMTLIDLNDVRKLFPEETSYSLDFPVEINKELLFVKQNHYTHASLNLQSEPKVATQNSESTIPKHLKSSPDPKTNSMLPCPPLSREQISPKIITKTLTSSETYSPSLTQPVISSYIPTPVTDITGTVAISQSARQLSESVEVTSSTVVNSSIQSLFSELENYLQNHSLDIQPSNFSDGPCQSSSSNANIAIAKADVPVQNELVRSNLQSNTPLQVVQQPKRSLSFQIPPPNITINNTTPINLQNLRHHSYPSTITSNTTYYEREQRVASIHTTKYNKNSNTYSQNCYHYSRNIQKQNVLRNDSSFYGQPRQYTNKTSNTELQHRPPYFDAQRGKRKGMERYEQAGPQPVESGEDKRRRYESFPVGDASRMNLPVAPYTSREHQRYWPQQVMDGKTANITNVPYRSPLGASSPNDTAMQINQIPNSNLCNYGQATTNCYNSSWQNNAMRLKQTHQHFCTYQACEICRFGRKFQYYSPNNGAMFKP